MPELFPYQKEGARFLASQRTALLADTMGLGKTAQTVVAVRKTMGDVALVKTPADAHCPVLVVCPASLTETWKREFRAWWPGDVPPPHLTVVSYDKLARNPEPYRQPWHVVVADEAHFLKNPKAKRTKAVLGPKMNRIGGVVEKAGYVWCLTGTPAPNNPSELWPLLRALNPGLLIPEGKTKYLPMNLHQFTHRYCVVRNNGFGEVIVRGQRLDELKKRMAPFVLRRRKDEVLKDLPELRFGELPLSSGQAEKALAQLEHGDVERLSKALKEGGADALSSLSTEMATVRRLTALAKAPAVAEWVNLWLETCDDKIVLFAQHREALDALERTLASHQPAVVHGSVPTARRNAEVVAFQNDPARRVFLGQIQAAGTGLTLTAASDLIFLEQSWTPADNVQAAMRIHRIGQKRGCLVRVATLPGSIDEAVQRTLARKTEDLVALFDAVA